jgi:hypothetical protein
MSETIPTGPTEPTPEELELQEQERQYAQYMSDHPDVEIPKEELRECGPEIAELEEMLALFESTHSLAELNLIVDLTPEEAPKHPVRESARVALIPIITKLNILKRETNISAEKYGEIKAKCRRLSNAVGMINKNIVDHDR